MPVLNSEPFEQWVLLERERLHLKAVRACRQLAAAYALHGDYERAQAPVRRQLELEPWNEEAHRQLMWLLARAGQRSAALAQYQACRRALAREVGVEPDGETTAPA